MNLYFNVFKNQYDKQIKKGFWLPLIQKCWILATFWPLNAVHQKFKCIFAENLQCKYFVHLLLHKHLFIYFSMKGRAIYIPHHLSNKNNKYKFRSKKRFCNVLYHTLIIKKKMYTYFRIWFGLKNALNTYLRQKSLETVFETGFSNHNKLLNPKRLWCSQKRGLKCGY